jgi:uncharacterized protein
MPLTIEVVDNAAEGRFEARVDGRAIAFSEYRLTPGRVWFLHTETAEAFEGQGVGGRLVEGALAIVRDRGLRVVAKCPFVSAWLRRHREYADLVDRA